MLESTKFTVKYFRQKIEFMYDKFWIYFLQYSYFLYSSLSRYKFMQNDA